MFARIFQIKKKYFRVVVFPFGLACFYSNAFQLKIKLKCVYFEGEKSVSNSFMSDLQQVKQFSIA